MLKGVLISLLIMFIGGLSILIPVVHFILPWIAPFIAGFVGSSVANVKGTQVALFGTVVAAFFLPFPLIFGLLALFSFDQIFGINANLIAILFFAIIPFAWFSVTLGAVVSYFIRSKQST